MIDRKLHYDDDEECNYSLSEEYDNDEEPSDPEEYATTKNNETNNKRNNENKKNSVQSIYKDKKIYCFCKKEAIKRNVKKEGPNKGRSFHMCGTKDSDIDDRRCKFFTWADDDNKSEKEVPITNANIKIKILEIINKCKDDISDQTLFEIENIISNKRKRQDMNPMEMIYKIQCVAKENDNENNKNDIIIDHIFRNHRITIKNKSIFSIKDERYFPIIASFLLLNEKNIDNLEKIPKKTFDKDDPSYVKMNQVFELYDHISKLQKNDKFFCKYLVKNWCIYVFISHLFFYNFRNFFFVFFYFELYS